MMRLVVGLTLLASVQAFCPNSCSGHGSCGDNDICECYERWVNADCSVRQCAYGLSWVAGTADDLADASVPNYMAHGIKARVNSGDNGEVMGLHAYTECSSKGTCDTATGECKCFAGYTGSGCRRASCPNDCSSHGRCTLDSDIYTINGGSNFYGTDRDLFGQKQYWNNRKSAQCICDAGFTGYDCSTRMCPQGDDPDSGCSSELEYDDVQLVTIHHISPNLAKTDPSLTEQFFTLKFTDMFNNEYQTKPLSYWDDATTVQQALMSLPNFVVPDVEVFKFWPLKQTTTITTIDAGCSKWYYETFQDVSCSTNDECAKKFGLTATEVFCDSAASSAARQARGEGTTLGVCVETNIAAATGDQALDGMDYECEFNDGDTEFSVCGNKFEPDGIYTYDDEGGVNPAVAVWGRRLTSFERGCHVGKFDSTDVTFAVACTTSADCTECGGWTQVKSGECDTVTNKCTFATLFPYNTWTTGLYSKQTSASADGFTAKCQIAAFAVKFSDNANSGQQNLLELTLGDVDTDANGASPKFESDLLDSSSNVIHAGMPDFTDGREESLGDVTGSAKAVNLCFKPASATTMADDCFAGYLFSPTTVNSHVEVQNLYLASLEGDQEDVPHQELQDGEQVYTEAEIAARDTASYDEVLQCSNQGACGYDTGLCTCADGFTGDACGIQVSYV